MPFLIWCSPEDHGRPWDDPSYHESGLGKILLPVAIIVIIIIAIGWMISNRETMGKILKNIFSIICIGGLIVGLFIIPLIDHYESDGESGTNVTYKTNGSSTSKKPQKDEVGYKTKTYRIDICRTCNGSGKYNIEANWGHTSVQCPTCHGSGKEKIPGNYR